jgi:hypothetical protein
LNPGISGGAVTAITPARDRLAKNETFVTVIFCGSFGARTGRRRGGALDGRYNKMCCETMAKGILRG